MADALYRRPPITVIVITGILLSTASSAHAYTLNPLLTAQCETGSDQLQKRYVIAIFFSLCLKNKKKQSMTEDCLRCNTFVNKEHTGMEGGDRCEGEVQPFHIRIWDVHYLRVGASRLWSKGSIHYQISNDIPLHIDHLV